MYMRLVLHTASVRLLLALKSFGICQLEIRDKIRGGGHFLLSAFVRGINGRKYTQEWALSHAMY